MSALLRIISVSLIEKRRNADIKRLGIKLSMIEIIHEKAVLITLVK